MKNWRPVTLVAALLFLAACTGNAAGPPRTGPTALSGSQSQAAANPALDTGTKLDGRPAPDFRLVNQFGQPMALHQFRGKVVLLAFADSRCTNVCPLMTESMVQAKELLGAAGSKVQLLGVDANPQATKVSDVMAYSRDHGMVNKWDYLTGSIAQLHAVWKDYHVAVEIDQGLIDHTPALVVIDPQGGERAIYLTQMNYASIGQAAQVLAQEMASLLPGHPQLASRRSLAHISGVSPASPVTMHGALSGSVQITPGKPHLVFFFATWLAETSSLRAHLQALNGYASAAHHGGTLPSLVAVDEAATEPSAAAVAAYLRKLPHPLGYPAGLDTTGRIADGFGVQDQPWFALVSASGQIIWHHDGWLPVKALEEAMRKAGHG